MEILAWLAGAVLINAACMAYIMKWQAHRIRGWTIRTGEALGVHARVSLFSGLCALAGLVGLAFLPSVSFTTAIGVAFGAFFVPYFFLMQRVAYQLARHQTERGRGVARRNVQQIATATFFSIFVLYGACAGLLYFCWRLANTG